MVNLTRYNPVEDTLDNLLNGFLMRPWRTGNPMGNLMDIQIKLDVKEDDKNYIVFAEIPGVRKDDIQVTIDGNQIAISAEVKDKKAIKSGERMVCNERFFGKVFRSITLDQDVDETSSEAKYNDGLLELVLHKKATALTKRLEIH